MGIVQNKQSTKYLGLVSIYTQYSNFLARKTQCTLTNSCFFNLLSSRIRQISLSLIGQKKISKLTELENNPLFSFGNILWKPYKSNNQKSNISFKFWYLLFLSVGRICFISLGNRWSNKCKYQRNTQVLRNYFIFQNPLQQ